MNWLPGVIEAQMPGVRPSLHVSVPLKDKKALQTSWFFSQQVDAQSLSAEHGPVINCDPAAGGAAWLGGRRPSLQLSSPTRDKKALQTSCSFSQQVDAQSESEAQAPVMN
jgi:hypothetical protein